MKNINQLIEEVKANPEFRAKFVGLDEAGIEQMLKDEGYNVSIEEVLEAAKNIDIELSPDELDKIAGGKSKNTMVSNLTMLVVIVTSVACTPIAD